MLLLDPVTTLKDNNVSTPTSHPITQSVRIGWWITGEDRGYSVAELAYMKLGLSIAPNVLYGRLLDYDYFNPGVPERQLPVHVTKQHAPSGQRFHCWRFEVDADFDTNVVKLVLLLALVCPNFDYAAVEANKREMSMAYMSEMLLGYEFRTHETRLRRLLFGG
ncbi:hypothetical protein GGI20_005403 [Coemansia sp. BCRC 34301]|nr:hypothetical protein GGI20_005403 [Coemansia sp. BCRC 34301]